MKQRKFQPIIIQYDFTYELVYQEIASLYTDSGILIQKGQDKNIEQQLELPTMVSSPVEQGQVLGIVTYVLNGRNQYVYRKTKII